MPAGGHCTAKAGPGSGQTHWPGRAVLDGLSPSPRCLREAAALSAGQLELQTVPARPRPCLLHTPHLPSANANPSAETTATEEQAGRRSGEQLNKSAEEGYWLESKGQREQKNKWQITG